MRYDPCSLEPYTPLWVWGPRDYLHIAGIADVSMGVQRFPFAHDGHVSCRLVVGGGWAVHQALRDPEAVVVRLSPWKGRVFRGLLPWVVGGLQIEVSRKKTVSPYQGTVLVNTRTGEGVVELPPLDLPPEERRVVLAGLRDSVLQLLPGAQLVGASTQHQLSSAIGQLVSLPALALDGGTLQATPGGCKVTALIGDYRMVTSVDRVEGSDPSYALIAAAETKAAAGPVPGLVRLSACPPVGKLDLKVFNRRLAPSPLRLFSWELLRVLQTLKVLRLWGNRWAAVASLPLQALDANVVADKKRAKAYVCLDDFNKCFTPTPHIWRQHADATWHGLPAPNDLGTRLLGCL